MPKKQKAPAQTGAQDKTYQKPKYKPFPIFGKQFSRTRQVENIPVHHHQEISTPDGVALNIVLEDETVFISDKNGNTISFSAHLTPEILATFHDVEKVFYGWLFNGH